MSEQDQAWQYVEKAATALDCAMQLHGGEHSDEINELEERCDELVKKLKGKT